MGLKGSFALGFFWNNATAVFIAVFLNQRQEWIKQEAKVCVLPLCFLLLFNPLLALAKKKYCKIGTKTAAFKKEKQRLV